MLRSSGFDLPQTPQTFQSSSRTSSGKSALSIQLEIESKYRIDDEYRLKAIKEGLQKVGRIAFIAGQETVNATIGGWELRVSEDTYMIDDAAALGSAQLTYRVRREEGRDTIITCKLPPIQLTTNGVHARLELEVLEPDDGELTTMNFFREANGALTNLIAKHIGDNVASLNPRLRIRTERQKFSVVKLDDPTNAIAEISADHVHCKALGSERLKEFFELEVEAEASQSLEEKIEVASGIGGFIRERWDLAIEPANKFTRATYMLTGQ